MRIVNSQINHCLDLLAVMAERGRGMRLTEIATALDGPKSSTQRLLEHLAAHGWVEQIDETGQYRLTLRLAVLGRRFLQTAGIADLAQDILDRLAERTGDLARLTAVEGGRRLAWIASAQGAPPGLRYEPSMGAPIPCFATANGKAWLATLPAAEAVDLARADGLDDAGARRRLGPGAASDAATLLADLEVVRGRGYAVADEEAEAGVMAVATTVREGPGAVLGTVSVAGPVARVRAAVPDIADALAGAAADLALAWPAQRDTPMEHVA